MHGPKGPHLKPATPMHGPIGPKQAHSRPQRRHRFHEPRQPRPQRRSGFHERPKNTTGSTTARPHPDPHETHNTNARPQPLKTGPSTPAKATPVSCAIRHHCHREPSTARSYLSLTGSLAPICESPVDVSRVFHAHRPDTDTGTATNLASPIGLGKTPSPRTAATSSRHRSCAPELFAGTIMLTNASTSAH